jgi:hypothetical protein
VPLRLLNFEIDVNQVRYGLEGIIGYTYGKKQMTGMKRMPGEATDVLMDKRKVLHPEEYRDICKNTAPEPDSFALCRFRLVYTDSAIKSDRGGNKQNQQQIGSLERGIEQVA